MDLPTTGWTIRPAKGPARNTRDIQDLDKPNEMRYGEALGPHNGIINFILSVHTTVAVGHSPYDISTDQKTCTPRSPIVNIGRRAHWGPMILEMPAHCASEVPCSARGKVEKPVICTQTSAGSRPLCFLVKHAQAFAYFRHSASSGKQQ